MTRSGGRESASEILSRFHLRETNKKSNGFLSRHSTHCDGSFWSTRALQPRRDARGLMDESGKVHVDKRSSKKKRFIY